VEEEEEEAERKWTTRERGSSDEVRTGHQLIGIRERTSDQDSRKNIEASKNKINFPA
jgi:hypothetical protein